MLCKVVLTFKSVDEILKCNYWFKWKLLSSTFCGAFYCVVQLKVVLTFQFVYQILYLIVSTVQMKATEQYFPVVLFIMLYKVIILIFESVDEILKCDHSNESYWAVRSCGAVYYAVQGGSIIWDCEKCDHSNESYWTVRTFPWYSLLCRQQGSYNLSLNIVAILKCDHSNES